MSPVVWIASGAFALGVALSGAVGGAAYWLQGAQLKRTQADLATLKITNQNAEREAKSKADAAQLLLDALSSDLAHSRKQRQVEYVHVESEIVRYTSPTTVALGHRAVRLLNDMPGTAPVAAPRADPQGAAGGGAAAAPFADGSASERAMTQYVAQVKHQYLALQDRHSRLARAVCAVPNVECE